MKDVTVRAPNTQGTIIWSISVLWEAAAYRTLKQCLNAACAICSKSLCSYKPAFLFLLHCCRAVKRHRVLSCYLIQWCVTHKNSELFSLHFHTHTETRLLKY